MSQGGNNLADFEAIKRDLLSSENSPKTSNNPPAVRTNITVVQHIFNTRYGIIRNFKTSK